VVKPAKGVRVRSKGSTAGGDSAVERVAPVARDRGVSINFSPLPQPRASREIASQIERRIFNGELQSGDRLESERELAERFKVSRMSVRDALRALENRGLVRVKVGATGGAFVSDTNVDRIAESMLTLIQLRRISISTVAEARTWVEYAAAGLAAEHADAKEIAKIQQEVDRGRSLVREQSPHAESSVQFHIAVAEASGNDVLSGMVMAYRDLIVTTLRDMREVRSTRVTQKAHEEILDAIRRHDAPAARQLTLSHLQDFENRLQRWLATRGPAEPEISRS
jgi:GntR family transcriptional repressor for pyruvate dehydrogenase complex